MTADRAFLFALEQIGIKLGLDQIRALLSSLGNPERAFPSILVAGTNGKGSVAAMVERALRAAGLRTGRYTSPHLVHLEERFAIDGRSIEPETLDRLAARVRSASTRLDYPPTFFEATTALALEAFRDAGVDVAVLEVGLGGRLDATNVVDPVAVAITLIDFDHEQYLGSTIEAIAAEKAGVIKPGALVVLGENPPAAASVVAAACTTAGADLVEATAGVTTRARFADGRATIDLTTPRGSYDSLIVGLRGRHQIANALTAIRLLEELDASGRLRIGPDAIRTGVERAEWPGRLELLPWRSGHVLLDGAHNPSGARALARFLSETYRRPLPIVLGIMRDKQAGGMIEALRPVASQFVLTAAASPRALPAIDLAAQTSASAPDVQTETIEPPEAALARAAAFGDPVVVAGSLYLVGEIRAKLS